MAENTDNKEKFYSDDKMSKNDQVKVVLYNLIHIQNFNSKLNVIQQ